MKRTASQTPSPPPRRSTRVGVSVPAPQGPERIDFIDRLTRPFFDGANNKPFVFKYTKFEYACGMATRTDTVYLKLACTLHRSRHDIVLKCFPVPGTDADAPEVPDAALLAAPYSESIDFWRRVRACQIDDGLVFNREDMSHFPTWSSFPEHAHMMYRTRHACFGEVMHAADLILTLVLDHVGCLRGSTPPVMSPYFNTIAMCFPHALIAHAHRWGNSRENALSVFPSFGGYDAFWRTFEAVCARMQLPATLDSARFINVEALNVLSRDTRGGSEFSPSFGRQFPRAENLFIGYSAHTQFVVSVARAFPAVKTMVFGVFNIRDNNRRSIEDLIGSITANQHMQKCICYFAKRVEFKETDDLMQDACAYVLLRHGLPTLTAADYKSLPKKQLPAEAADVKAWTAFFNSPIFERETLGIVQKFIYGAGGAFVCNLQERIDAIRF
jgi:hypothetical protein